MAREPWRYRDADGNLRLDEALGEDHVRHYVGILSGANEKFDQAARALANSVVASPPGESRAWYSWQEFPQGEAVGGYTMTTAGSGPRTASSCQELALSPQFCWDVCGYYAMLGVHWRATARQIRVAYMAMDPAQEDTDLFYAMSQLLDPVIRRAYDLCAPGELFMGDLRVQQMIEHAAAIDAARQNAEAWLRGDDYDPSGAPPGVVTHAKVLRDWGFDTGLTDAEARDRLRSRYAAEQEPLGGPESALGKTIGSWERQWSWFKLTGLYDPYDPQVWPGPWVLEAWQMMIVRALSEAGVTMHFAVGIWPGHGPKIWHVGKESCIFFIGNGLISQEMATEAAEMATEARQGFRVHKSQPQEQG